MKHLIMLLAAAAIIVVSWWLIGEISHRRDAPPTIQIPQNLADKPGLIRSANQLWDAKPDYFDSRQVATFLKLLVQNLDDDSWRAVSGAAYFAWSGLRGSPSVRPQLLELDESLLPKFVGSGALPEIEGLVRIADEKAFDSLKISQTLEKYVAVPLPPGSFPGSRQEEIIASSIHVNAYPRAEQLMGKLVWSEGGDAADKSSLARLKYVIDACRPSPTGARVLSRNVEAWSICGGDIVGRLLLQPNLEDVALAVIDSFEQSPASPKLTETFSETATIPGADPYWSKVLYRTVPGLVGATAARISVVARLTHEYSSCFKKPTFEFLLWMKTGTLTEQWRPNDPIRAIGFYERSRSVAVTDTHRVLVAQKLIALCGKAYEFTQGRTIAEETAKAVTDPEQAKAAALLLQEAKKKEEADLARVKLQEKAIDLDQRRGRLQAMKDNLAAAKRAGRPPEQVQAIQTAIKDLEKRLTE